ncbi:MAG TPA: UDP-N-acetylmuramate--L-alanine ligase [Candidatus Omnitrophota bacterium]|nr:UDP-N-acetylmuramate--L-alanine ligase [Candidatus Omnitrophota bacterium]HPN88425.1 UDP-N-acetylmuramate--L-alanine ligase [Candidatus Omnitrophota bacterium]
MRENYHFVGIGGIGMGALALLLLEKGHCVSGSDLRENDLTVQLKQKGARIFLGHDAKNVTDVDFIIFSSAVKEDNPEIQEALRRNIPIIRRAELLADLMREHQEITIAGAHGKTTTTSMIANLLKVAQFDPTIAIGGMVNQTKQNAFLGRGKYFVAEVDESDGSFLNFAPDYSIITNIDYEHPDYYESLKSVLEAYESFVSRTKLHGVVIGCAENPHVLNLLLKNKRKYMTYGFSKKYDVSARNMRLDHFSSRFICYHKENPLGEIILSVPGEHNVLNALACVCLGLKLEIDFATIKESLRAFQGVQRRLELIGEIKGVRIMDDYGHHPTEILATLKAASHFGQKRLIVTFQPHRYTRLEKLFNEFTECFDLCDHLIITDIYAASEKPIEGISGEKLALAIQQKMKKQVCYLKKNDILKYLLGLVTSGDCFLTLGAGDITQISKQLYQALKEKF